MKKFVKIFSLLLVMTSVVVFQACKDDEDPTPAAAPTATAPSAITAVQINGSTDVTFTFKADGGYKSATATAVGGTATVKTPGTAGATTGNVVVTFAADANQGAGAVTLTLTDNNNQTAVAVATLNKTISAPPSVSLSQTEITAGPGSVIKVTLTVDAENGTKNVTYTTSGGLAGSPASPIAASAITDGAVELSFTVPDNASIGAVYTATIYATDNQNLNSASVVLTITASTKILTGKLTANMTLKKDSSYLIKGQFVVASGVTLTVEPGAVIKGDKASKGVLIVKQGGILHAEGEKENPIVFTSSKPAGERDRGDWGGIILMGDAYVNQSAKPAVEGLTPPTDDADFFKYGTINQADASVGVNDQNSGILKYVRIEYAGIELIPNSETNGLTMAGVGSGTTIEYVQSSYGGDDGFEWFGGSVSAKHLVSLATWDDDFDTDFGWRGNVQFGLAIRAAFVADQSGSTSFESDSQGNANAIGTVCDGTNSTGCTQGVFSNMTVLGPRDFNIGVNITASAPNGIARAISGNYTRAMHIRRRTAISIFNSFIAGYGSASGPAVQGLQMDDAGTLANYDAGVGAFGNNVLLYPEVAGAVYGTNVTTGTPLVSIQGYWQASSTAVKPAADALWSLVPGTPAGSVDPYGPYGIAKELFFGANTAASYPSNPNFAVTTGSLTAQSDLFTSSKLGEFFDNTVTYKGAFGAEDWTDTWAEFNPLSKAY